MTVAILKENVTLIRNSYIYEQKPFKAGKVVWPVNSSRAKVSDKGLDENQNANQNPIFNLEIEPNNRFMKNWLLCYNFESE